MTGSRPVSGLETFQKEIQSFAHLDQCRPESHEQDGREDEEKDRQRKFHRELACLLLSRMTQPSAQVSAVRP